MFSAYYNDDGILIKDRKTVITTYMKGWFIIDFLACFPFETLIRYFGKEFASTG